MEVLGWKGGGKGGEGERCVGWFWGGLGGSKGMMCVTRVGLRVVSMYILIQCRVI